MVVAPIEDEAPHLKKFYREKDHVRLGFANWLLKPIRGKRGDFVIQGQVAAVQRML